MSAPLAVPGPIRAEALTGALGGRCTWPSEQPGSLEATVSYSPTEPAGLTAANDYTRESRGGAVLIADEGEPVAHITPFFIDRRGDYRAVIQLIRSGIVEPPTSPGDVESLLASPNPSLPDGVSASRLIATERDTGW